jgi:hypothetical protein
MTRIVAKLEYKLPANAKQDNNIRPFGFRSKKPKWRHLIDIPSGGQS